MSCVHCPHCNPGFGDPPRRFRHGDRVLHAERGIGKITGRPREGSTTTYVVWPDGWAGHVPISELEHALST